MSLFLLLNAQVPSGTFVVTLAGILPKPRHDQTPWGQVRVEEAAVEAGPWTTLVTADLQPVDDDPATPQTRDISVAGVTLPSGWYRVTFVDGVLEDPHAPVYSGPPIRPSAQEIAVLLHTRTTADGSLEAGRWLDEDDDDGPTNPTRTQVERLIDVALGQVAPKLPDELTVKQTAAARGTIAYLAAVLVEKSHYSEQVAAGASLAPTYETFFMDGLTALTSALVHTPGTDGWSVPVGSPTLTAYRMLLDGQLDDLLA